MNLIFAGTPEFAAVALAALLDAGHAVPLVLTQPDRPAGRGMKLTFSPVKKLALDRGLRVEQPATLRDPATQAMLREAIATGGIEAMVVAAYGLILPQAVLDLPPRGCLNIHASLLPRWRGAAPIQRAIEAGDAETGIGIMQMEAGLDTGPVLLERRTPIGAGDTGGSLHDRLATLGGEAIVEALGRIDGLVPRPQPADGVTYAHKLAKAEAALDFTQSAVEIARRVRAFDPFPGTQASLGGEPWKIWAAVPMAGEKHGPAAGTILAASHEGIDIACGDGVLRATEVQKAGGKRLKARDFVAGTRVAPGDRFSPP